MKWRVKKTNQGYCIEYKDGFISLWRALCKHRSFSFEPFETQFFKKESEARREMIVLVKRIGGELVG